MGRSGGAVREEYARLAPGYDTRWARYNRESLELLRPLLAEDAPGRLLDVGCGTANLAYALRAWGVRPARYLGVDLTPGMLRVAAEKLRADPPPWTAHLAAADASALPLRAESFDTVVSASSLHDWPEPRRALAGVRTLLRPGGRLLLLDWARDALSMKLLDRWLRLTGSGHHHVYTAAECTGLLEGAGFAVRRAARRRIGGWWEVQVVEGIAP